MPSVSKHGSLYVKSEAYTFGGLAKPPIARAAFTAEHVGQYGNYLDFPMQFLFGFGIVLARIFF